VIGTIKTYQNRRHINATIVRIVEDPMEAFFHFNEVMAVTMMHNHGPVSRLFTAIVLSIIYLSLLAQWQ
jgi:hypothetical protein